MTKRPADEPVDTYRDIKRIRLDLEEATKKKKVVTDQYYAILEELNKHPVSIAQYERDTELLNKERLKKFLPPYLYDVLVVKGIAPYGSLVAVEMSDDEWPDMLHMHKKVYRIKVHFSEGEKGYYALHVDIEHPEDEVKHADLRCPHDQLTLKGSRSIKTNRDLAIVRLWENALQFNNDEAPKAVASLILWAMNKTRLEAVRDEEDFPNDFHLSDVRDKLIQLKGANTVESKTTDVLDGSANVEHGSESGSSKDSD